MQKCLPRLVGRKLCQFATTSSATDDDFARSISNLISIAGFQTIQKALHLQEYIISAFIFHIWQRRPPSLPTRRYHSIFSQSPLYIALLPLRSFWKCNLALLKGRLGYDRCDGLKRASFTTQHSLNSPSVLAMLIVGIFLWLDFSMIDMTSKNFESFRLQDDQILLYAVKWFYHDDRHWRRGKVILFKKSLIREHDTAFCHSSLSNELYHSPKELRYHGRASFPCIPPRRYY